MIKSYRIISILVVLLVIFSLISSLAGLFSQGGRGEYIYESISGEEVKIYGDGIYKNDSHSMVAQGKASDFVTLALGVPLLLFSLYLARKESFRGRLMLTGTLGYFLYTYMSYTFLWTYNQFFLIYVLNMSISLFTFIILISSFNIRDIKERFAENTPTRYFGIIQIILGLLIGMMWILKLLPSIFTNKVAMGLDHYTTFVIQGMDLGIVVPFAIISGILILRGKPEGYLFTSIILIKGFTMVASIGGMIVNQFLKGVEMNIIEVIVFPIISLFIVGSFILLMKCVKS